MKFLIVLVALVGFGETYRTSVQHCGLTLQKDGAVLEDGVQALGIGGDLNQVYCMALCSGPGPTPALNWYNGQRRRISYFRRRVYQVRTTSERINILTFRNMLSSDVGRYTCKAWIRNQGWIETTFELVYACQSSDYLCDRSKCISGDLVCNGVADCRDGTDEQYCDFCSATQFKCDDGECVPAGDRCNRYYDCVDGSDEYNCGCLPDFKCSHGSFLCVSQDKVCDGHYDCWVGEDEANCSAIKVSMDKTNLDVTVGETAVFTCTAMTNSSRGYKLSWTKDGTPLSEEATDEASVLVINDAVKGDSGNYVCFGTDGLTSDNAAAELLVNEVKCTEGLFLCPDDRHCITTMQLCDGRNDCGDNWDEEQCRLEPVCETDQYACSDGRCINSTHLCDHVDDCQMGEDETNCTCKQGEEFTCTSDDECIAIGWRCDGDQDCSDGSDECGCYPDEFICDDGLCINKSRQCNNVRDCKGGEDENDCPKTCIDSQFLCPDGSHCLETMQVCDGKKDCDDNWDEEQQCEY